MGNPERWFCRGYKREGFIWSYSKYIKIANAKYLRVNRYINMNTLIAQYVFNLPLT